MIESTKTASIPRIATFVPSFLARLPRYTYLGAVLNGCAWVSSWARIGPWPYTFFPLWLGFILVLDGLNVARHGTSPLTRGWRGFAAMFVLSVPFWWAFEVVNVVVQNWHYQLDHQYSWLGYHVISSIDFSTVLPVVMEMAELLAGTALLRPRVRPSMPGVRLSRAFASRLIAVGIGMLALTLVLPHYAYPLVWTCGIFIVDPINNLAGRKSAFAHLLARDWGFIVSLSLAALICGFFWEMWNYPALPKWYYTVPFLDHAPHLFEMPLPGFLGYLPFGEELFVMYQFSLLVLGIAQGKDALVI